jgi:5-deoxy-glucuronate isomerase
VRTIFDRENSHPDAELVLGEVVNLPGRWSSYPPHHHPQPEIYHYRFTAPEGWGHAELGETVLKVRSYDTVKIFDGNDHPQCAAPGYGMYYSWVIRHLPQKQYDVPEFTGTHKWILEKNQNFWWPRGLEEES